jgi:threonine/homoserine/homoserine lactone efflux protein
MHMIELSNYLLFLASCLALIIVPGPAQALVLARTLADGPRAGTLTAIGLNIGTLCHSMAAAMGLSAVLASSALAFAIVKYAGAGYLIYLGIRALRAPAPTAPRAATRHVGPLRSPLVQAVVTGALNPKVALFFLAFLPQFVDPTRGSALLQFLVLGASMAVLDTLYEVMLVYLISRVSRHETGSVRIAIWQNRVCGTVLVALGLRLLAQER